MVQIIQEREKSPSFLQKLAAGFVQGVPAGMEKYEALKGERKRNKAYEELGIPEGTPPDLAKTVLAEKLKADYKKDLLEKKQDFITSILGKSGNVVSEKDGEMPSEGKFSKISDQDIVEATAIDPTLGKALRDAKDAEVRSFEGKEKEIRRKFEADREYHSKRSDPIINAAEQVVKNAPINRTLIQQQRRDIASGNTSGVIPFLVEKLGLESYRDPESARFKTASKQRFVESIHELGGAGARPNQFIEQQLTSAQPALGRSEEANQGVLDLEEFIEDMKLQRAKYELELAEQDLEKFGYARNDISQRADKMMKDYTEQRQDEMAYDIRKRHEDNLDDTQLVQEIVSGNVPYDTPLTMRVARILMIKNNDDEKKATAEAKRLGFRFPTEKTYSRGTK
jgi:hypothetical protein